MKTIMALVALIVAASAVQAQDPTKPGIPKPEPKFKTEFKLILEGEAPQWTFRVEGTTTLPDGVVLKARLFAVEEVDDFKGGKRPDEESLIQEHRGWRSYTVRDGKIGLKLLDASRRPYSIWYRARLTYDPDVQDLPLFDKVGATPISWDSDLKLGAPKDFERELALTVKALTVELEEVQSLFRDLRGKFQVWTRAPDPAAFEEWRKGFAKRVEAIRKNNETRWSIWIVWLERQAKFRFENFSDRLDMLCADFEEWLGVKARIAELSKGGEKHRDELKRVADEEQDRQLRIMHGLNGFLAYFEEAREALGIDTPSDPDAVGGHLKDYEAATDELAALAAKRDAALWKERAPAARSRARRALMRLSAPGLLPRRAYDRVLELAEKFGQLHALLERAAAGEKSAPNETAAEHTALVAEFRKYAGVK
jgi:hypothetical protein